VVFTVRVSFATALRRRTLLTGAAAAAGASALTLAGCGLIRRDEVAVDPVGPDRALLESVAADARALANAYGAAIAMLSDSAAPLSAVREDHVAHARALAELLAPRASVAPTPSVPIEQTGEPPTMAVLLERERAAVARAADACLRARSDHAPLLGSIAAARRCHTEVLA
jgi:hypothetical protein